jgi:PAS domain S-box-containing protein
MQRRIWVAAFASFTTACVGFWAYSVTQDRAATLRDVERQTVTTARLLEEQAERTFEAGGLLLSLLAEIGQPEALRAPGAGQKAFERLRAAVESSPQIGSAWVLDAYGNNLLDSWSWPPRPSNGSQRGYFQEHKNGRRDLYIGPPEPGSVTGTNRFTLSRPLLDEQGDLEGVAVVAVYGQYFEQFYREAGLAPGSAIRLMTAGGTVLAAWPADASPEQDEGFALLVERLREGALGTVFLAEHGVERVLAYRALSAVPVAVGVLAPLEPALAAWRGRTLRSGLVLAAALLGFGLLVGMGLKLAQRQRLALIELGEAKTSLEARVQERTADLEQREAELRLIADAVPALVSYVDGEERYRFVNKAYEDWFGRGRDAVQGRTVREVVGDEAYQVAVDHVAKALAGEHVVYQAVLPYRDGGARHVDAQYIPHLGPDGRTRGFYAFVVDVTERERSAAALRESEARYRALAEAIAAVIWITPPDGLVSDMPRWRALTGQTVEEVRGWGWLEALHPDHRARTAELWRRCVESGTVYDTEYRLRSRDGDYGWYNARGVAVRDEDGAIREWVGVCIDISQRKLAEERQTLLMAELDHRVRNILASIQSMVSLTRRSATTIKEYAEALHGRIAAMARTHDLLTRARWSGAGLEQIVRDELQPYDPDGHVVTLNGALDCILRPRQALNFALVLHELVTNAAKYGALSAPDGRITVSWNVERRGAERYLCILWQESGGPAVSRPGRRGFGSTLIENALRAEPDSDVRLDFDPAGVRCAITLRLEEVPAGRRMAAAALPRVGRAGAPLPPDALRGARILVVEDETLVAVELRLALSDAGAEVLGPAASIGEAKRLLAAHRPTAAVLDVNLGDDRIDPLADLLMAEGVPMVFVTGYGPQTALPERLRHLRVLQKPLDPATLISTVFELVAAPAAPAATDAS